MSDPPFVILERLTKRFGGVAAVDGLSLGVPRGDLLALLGPSGSGKTTTLRLLAGFEIPDEGRIVVDGEDVTGTPPPGRGAGRGEAARPRRSGCSPGSRSPTRGVSSWTARTSPARRRRAGGSGWCSST